MSSFEEIYASLNKDVLSKVRLAQDITKEVIPTASYGLNKALGGGFRKGKQHTIWGTEQSSKSSMILQTIGINQKLGNTCAWIDAEHSFDEEWARELGVDNSKLIVSSVSSFEDAANLQIDLIHAGIDIIVVDSIGILIPDSFIDKVGEIKRFEDTRQIGTKAANAGKMVSMVNAINFTTSLIYINQARVDAGGFVPVDTTTGGRAYSHADSLRLKVFASATDGKAIKDKVQYGSVLVEKKVGIDVNWTIQKNKLNGNYTSGSYKFYIDGDHIGVDYHSELLDDAIKFGIVERGASWYTILGKSFQGEHKASEYLRNNPDVTKTIEDTLASL